MNIHDTVMERVGVRRGRAGATALEMYQLNDPIVSVEYLLACPASMTTCGVRLRD